MDPPNNKRRKVNTCLPCRKRKIACDQAVPACSRCVRTNKTGSCVYLDDDGVTDNIVVASAPATTSTHRTTSPQNQSSPQQSVPLAEQSRQLKTLQDELVAVRRELAVQRQQATSASERLVSRPDRQDATNGIHHDPEITGVKGDMYKTRYFGLTYSKTLLQNIPHLTALSKEIVVENPVLKKIRKDVIQHTDGAKSAPFPSADVNLSSALPTRSEADELLRLYLNFDNIFHILHRPAFLEEYERLWTGVDQPRPHFVALVLLITATARSLKREEPCLYIGKNSVARQRALITISSCEDWLRKNEKLKKATVTDFQIRFLICFGKAVHGAQFKKGWEEAATALRRAMAAGMHIEPSKAAPEVQEMRRRIWCAVAEFELQTAFVRGMPADPLSLESNVHPPSNIEDDQLSRSPGSGPQTQSLETFTSISYLVIARRSFNLRCSLTRILNSPKPISFEETRSLTEEIESHIQEVPKWPAVPNAEAPSAMLKVNLMNYLLVLHNRQFQHATCPADRSYSAMIVMKYAAEVTQIHSALLENGNRILLQLSHEEIRPALSICHIMEHLNPTADRMLCHMLHDLAEQVTTGVVELVADKARLGAGRNKYWLALVADAFVKIWKRPSQRSVCISDAVNTLAASSYKVIASQNAAEPMLEGASSFKENEGLGANAINGMEELSSIDLDQFSFDEWAFDSHHFNAAI